MAHSVLGRHGQRGALLVAMMGAGCGGESTQATRDMTFSPADTDQMGAGPVSDDQRSDRGDPRELPEHFGFGKEASAQRIALWDIDVRPDGVGLPPGSGSVAQGRTVYNLQCLACHGPTGTEGPNDPLVGPPPGDDWPRTRAAGHYWPYATTLFDYIRRAMPQLTPGTLSDEDTYAVIAYILYLNDLVEEDTVLDAASLAAIEMPARDRFVTDDRRGGPEVR